MDRNFADITKTVLDAYGWTETQLAERLETNQPTVNRIKRGRSKSPRFDLATRLIALYDARPRSKAA
jgi:transcriptional regulator with XRE-family HTH domain